MLVRVAVLTILIGGCIACSTENETDTDAATQANDGGLAAAELNDLGVAHMGRYEYEPARRLFEQALAQQPDPQIRVNLAIATLNRQQEGDEQRALDILEAVPADNLRAVYLEGLIHLYLGQTERAIDSLGQVVAEDPYDAYATYFLGQASLQRGDAETAATHLIRAIELDPYLRSAYWAGSQALKRLGREDEAAALLADYERFEASPNARLADFAYRRMGTRADALPLQTKPTAPLRRPDGPLFAAKLSVTTDTFPTSLTAVDLGNDGTADLVATGPDTSIRFTHAESDFLIADELTGARGLLWGDIDNDGQTDFVACGAGGTQLWFRDGDMFRQSETSIDAPCRDAILIDADHDGDLDVFATGEKGTELLGNNADGTFRSLGPSLGFSGKQGRQVIAADLDADRDLDVVILGDDGTNEVWRNDRTWRYEFMGGINDFPATNLVAITIADVDIDGRPELYGMAPNGAIHRWQWTGPDQPWQRTSLAQANEGGSPLALDAADLDGDRVVELLRTTEDGVDVVDSRTGDLKARVAAPGTRSALAASLAPGEGPSLVIASDDGIAIHPPGTGRFDFLTLSLSGRSEAEQMRSNASGIGTEVHARVGDSWAIQTRLDRHSGPGQSLAPIAIGLAGYTRADYVELTWSDGVSQTEIDLAGSSHHQIEETQRQLASCPVLFAWNGEKWTFVSDVLGVGGIGFFAEPGVAAPPRPFEFYLLEEGDLAARNGRLQLKFAEPMEETGYLDTARIHVIDLPRSWQLVLDERMGIAGPPVTGRPITWRDEAAPASAVNDRGEDITAAIAKTDLQAAPVGHVDPRFIGLLDETRSVTLEFDEAIDRPGATLVASGWIEYPYSQTVFAAWQAGKRYEAPTIEARDGDGSWHTVVAEFGYPAGMPRQMALPLPELPAGTNALRLSSNMEIYWDRLAVAFEEPMPAAYRVTLQPVAARVARTGFAKRTTGPQRLPHYDYGERTTYWDAKYQRGFYTAYGDALPLVAEHDGAVAIIGSGEEVHLEFSTPEPPAEGLRRYYVLEFRGWAKDMDLYTATGDTVAPLPEPEGLTPAARESRDELHRRFNLRFREAL